MIIVTCERLDAAHRGIVEEHDSHAQDWISVNDIHQFLRQRAGIVWISVCCRHLAPVASQRTNVSFESPLMPAGLSAVTRRGSPAHQTDISKTQSWTLRMQTLPFGSDRPHCPYDFRNAIAVIIRRIVRTSAWIVGVIARAQSRQRSVHLRVTQGSRGRRLPK